MINRALENAEAAVAQLVAFLAEPVTSDRDRAGVIQAFDFTFEATWKLLKNLAEHEGLDAESPRRALIAGYKLGLIKDEALWLKMLQDRNLTTHVYPSSNRRTDLRSDSRGIRGGAVGRRWGLRARLSSVRR